METEGDMGADPFYYVDTMGNDAVDRNEDYNRGQEGHHLTFKPTLVDFDYTGGDMKDQSVPEVSRSVPSQFEKQVTMDQPSTVPVVSELPNPIKSADKGSYKSITSQGQTININVNIMDNYVSRQYY